MKKLLAFALAGVAGGAPLLGCERLFGVDFGDTPSRDDAGGGREDADADEDAGDGATLPDAAKDGGDGAAPERCAEPCAAAEWSKKAAVAIAVDATNVYYGQPQVSVAAELFRCAKADGCKTSTKVTTTPDPVKLVELGGTLYWSTATAVKSIAASANDGLSTQLYVDPVALNTFAVGGGFLYPRRSDQIFRCALGAPCGASPTVVIGGQGGAPSLVVTSDKWIVWGATIDSEVHTCDPANCGLTKRTAGSPYDRSPVDAIAKGSVAVWTMPGPTPAAGVYICAGNPCTARLLAASAKPITPVIDGEDVYWGDVDMGAILRCPIVGACPKAANVHVNGQSLTTKDQIVVDADGVYWTTSAGIRRAPK